jgi:hypothetical protein
MRADVARLSKTIWAIDSGAKGERGEWTHAGHGHQLSARGFDADLVEHSLCESADFIGHDLDNRQQRIDQPDEHGVSSSQLAHPCRRVLAAWRSDLQPGLTEQRALMEHAPRCLLHWN